MNDKSLSNAELYQNEKQTNDEIDDLDMSFIFDKFSSIYKKFSPIYEESDKKEIIKNIKEESSKLFWQNVLLKNIYNNIKEENDDIIRIWDEIYEDKFDINNFNFNNVKLDTVENIEKRKRKKKNEIERTHSCRYCNNKYGSYSSLNQHFRLKHPIEFNKCKFN